MPAAVKSPVSVDYPSTDFDHAVAALAPSADAPGEKGNGARVLFVDVAEEAYQPALSSLMKATGFDVHLIDMEPLVADDQMASQGNVREVFDTANIGSSILVLTHADRFIDAVAWQERGADPDKRTAVHYLFDRIKHFGGIVVLIVNATNAADVMRYVPIDLVVEF